MNTDCRLVVDNESDNECDCCGFIISVGTEYYAQVDDYLILCDDCYNNPPDELDSVFSNI